MPKYSTERKESILSKLLPANRCSIAELSKSEGISQQTLYAWRHQARQSGNYMPNNKRPDRWDKQTKFTVERINGVGIIDPRCTTLCGISGRLSRLSLTIFQAYFDAISKSMTLTPSILKGCYLF